jgi:asparagine synthetase B (glutamine-hydrolysing)
MCGIFGVVAHENVLTFQDLEKISDRLFLLSESRGKESSGIAISVNGDIRVFKSPFPASAMIRNGQYKKFFRESLQMDGSNRKQWIHHPLAMIGHSRLVTNGSQENHDNNQPVIKDGIAAVHNGIVVNDEHLWNKYPVLRRFYQVDTEVVLSLIRHFQEKNNSIVQAVCAAYSLLEGTASIAMLVNDQNSMVLGTNNGSLYFSMNKDRSLLCFASEAYILDQFLLKSPSRKNKFDGSAVEQLKAGNGLLIDTVNLNVVDFSLAGTGGDIQGDSKPVELNNPIQDLTPVEVRNSAKSTFAVPTIVPESIYKKFLVDEQPIQALRRCTRCVLPETMPFIEFDDEGVCNYCRMYKKQDPLGEEELERFVHKYRRKDGKPDCVITFSGGRDSSYALHYLKMVLKMNPIAYTYDWGMITDLGRRNQARLCGKLGVEHILVSADINLKRSYIRKNVLAWLKRPQLGTVPLFMAGDKQYFYYANKMRQQLGLDLIVLATNPLEETFFKFGFCGLPPSLTRPTLAEQFKLASFYAREYILNPAYINSSLLDTLGAFASYYTIPHNYLRLYKYILWDEGEINSVMHEYYDWEVATDTKTTWRIGDGTAAFYNYIYYTIAGFSENDTFRSNQIREGVISREKALDIVRRENQPRLESIQWYCDSIGINMAETLERINKAPKLYAK